MAVKLETPNVFLLNQIVADFNIIMKLDLS